MAEFVCRLGTPGGEIVTRTVEAVAANEVRTRLEREGFKVFAITPPKGDGLASFTKGGGTGRAARVKANDVLLFNQQLAALLGGHSHPASHHNVTPPGHLSASALGAGGNRRSYSWRLGVVTGIRGSGSDISAHLHGLDFGGRAIRGARRSALALCELYATVSWAAAKNSG